MSNEALNAVFYCSKSRGVARLVLVCIADGVGSETQEYHGSVGAIAARAGCELRWARAKIAELVKLGEVVIEEREGRTSRYFIPIMDGEEGYDRALVEADCTERHTCNGHHMPLSSSRVTVYRAAVAARRRQSRAGGTGTPARSDRGPRHDQTGDPGTIMPPPSDPGTIMPPPRHDHASPPARSDRGPRHDHAADPISNPSLTQIEPTRANHLQPSPETAEAEAEAEAERTPPVAPAPPAAEPDEVAEWARTPRGTAYLSAAGLSMIVIRYPDRKQRALVEHYHRVWADESAAAARAVRLV